MADAAGQRRADEVLDLFVQADVDLRVMTLPDRSDPADFISDFGREKFESMVADSPDAMDHKLSRLTEGIDVTRDTHAVMKAIETMIGVISKAPRNGQLKVDQLMMRMARTFGLPIGRLNERLVQARNSNRGRPSRHTPVQSGPSAVSPMDPNMALAQSAEESEFGIPADRAQGPPAQLPAPTLQPITGIDRELFELLIESPDLAGTAVESIDPVWLDSNASKMLLSAYQDLDLAGRDLTVESLLLLIENEFLKNQINVA